MRRALGISLWIVAVLLGGCTSGGKKGLFSHGPTPPSPPTAPRPDPLPPPNWTESQPGPVPGASSMLAGQIIDAYQRKPPTTTYIQVTAAPSAADAKPPAPIEVLADANGYFTIQGLEPGRHYRLVARGNDGQRLLAGTTWATPPDPKVVIRISEDYASAQTPPLPPTPAWTDPTKPPAPVWPDKPGDSAPAPGNNATPRRAAELGAPLKPDEPEQPTHPENIVDSPAHEPRDLLQIRPQVPRSLSPAPVSPAPLMNHIGMERSPVPSCVLTGNTLSNFALTDLQGQPWEFRQHRGRLVLLDFWGTWCAPCRSAIPKLVLLQQTYGRYGLEVVGIAYEEGNHQEKVTQVQNVATRLGVNYRLLLGGDRANCPVRTQFQVDSWPTLVLLDENGHILARKEGADIKHFHELELIIRQKFGFPGR